MAPATGAGRRVLVLEPYFGGSHRAVLEALLPRLADAGWAADTLTLPARKWKWRMRGAAITMAGEARALDLEWRAAHPAGELARPGARARWDLVYASTFVNLAEFVALAGDAVAGVPRIVYFHENQLLYPNRHSAEWDFQFPLTNITSALCADACLFNTRWNMDGFLQEVPTFLREFPDHRPAGVAESIEAKSSVLHPPFDPGPFDAVLGGEGVAEAKRSARCRILWPHRWEHDKAPEAFFAACATLAAEGLDFEVAIAGKAFAETKGAFERAGTELGDRLVHLGEPDSRADYAELLAGSDVAVSTARNEFFGLAMMEASYAGCFPLVPDRLAYPELYPPGMRYSDGDELVARLRSLVLERPAPGQARELAERFTAGRLAPEYSEAFERAVQGREARRG
jgi:glycosyltransferase involved in cell wall biosynthesis